MLLPFLTICLVWLPSLVSMSGHEYGDGSDGDDEIPAEPFDGHCCEYKYSPGTGMYQYYTTTPGVSDMYGCVDDCVYVREGTRDKFCFGPGDLQTRCEESSGLTCGPPECNTTCNFWQNCHYDQGVVCVQEPCCASFSCVDIPPLYQMGNITVLEEGTKFNQTNEDTPDYLKISVPAHNEYPEAVVFYQKSSSMLVSCTQGRDTAAEVERVNTAEVMEYVKANEGNVIDASKEIIEYFVETVTTEEIPDNERPVDIAPDRPIYRSRIRLVSPNEFDELVEVAEEIPSCIRWPNTHHITIRVDSDTQMEDANIDAPSK